MSDPSELYLSGGGSTTIATDVMRADVDSLSSLSAALDTIRVQLAIADATLTETARAMTQVRWARTAMDEAWTAMDGAQGVSDYLGGQLLIAIENYTETERNVEAMAMGVDQFLSFWAGAKVASTPELRMIAENLPAFVRALFGNQTDAIDAYDVDPTNPLFNDENFIDSVRRFVMTGESFADGYGGMPEDAAAKLTAMGFTGAALSGQLLLMYASQAGLLSETNVKVSPASSTPQPGPITTTVDRIAAIPDAARRPDGAQIRIDTIHDGSSTRYEVFIAGTEDFNPVTGSKPFDLTSNVAGVAGGSPASYRAVELAMQQAGITGSSEVAFVGYSQGGLIASMLAASGDYNTQGLTTIGGPSGQIIIPPEVPALLIEHFEDIIPALGGTQANTDALIVRRHAFSAEYPPDPNLALPGHQLQHYLETARAIDRAESALLQGTVDQLNAFSAGASITTTYYVAERVP